MVATRKGKRQACGKASQTFESVGRFFWFQKSIENVDEKKRSWGKEEDQKEKETGRKETEDGVVAPSGIHGRVVVGSNSSNNSNNNNSNNNSSNNNSSNGSRSKKESTDPLDRRLVQFDARRPDNQDSHEERTVSALLHRWVGLVQKRKSFCSRKFQGSTTTRGSHFTKHPSISFQSLQWRPRSFTTATGSFATASVATTTVATTATKKNKSGQIRQRSWLWATV